jgi:hypothetical protein
VRDVSCVIDYDVHATELLDGLVESIGNGVLVCDVETNAQEVLLGRVLELQLLRLAGGGDSDVFLVKHLLDIVLDKTRGGAGDEKDLRHGL